MLTVEQSRQNQNQVVLANATELAQCVIARVMGGDISTHLNGEMMRAQDVADTVVAHLRKPLAKYFGV